LIRKKEIELRKLEHEAQDAQRRIEHAEREQLVRALDVQHQRAEVNAALQKRDAVVTSPLTPVSPHSGVSSSRKSDSEIEGDDLERRRQRIRHQAKAARKWRKDQGLDKVHPDSKHTAPIESLITDERRLHGPMVLE
jgi:hypothetical protein